MKMPSILGPAKKRKENFKKKTHQNSRAGLFEKIALVLVSRLAYVVESTSWYLRKVFFFSQKKETFRFERIKLNISFPYLSR